MRSLRFIFIALITFLFVTSAVFLRRTVSYGKADAAAPPSSAVVTSKDFTVVQKDEQKVAGCLFGVCVNLPKIPVSIPSVPSGGQKEPVPPANPQSQEPTFSDNFDGENGGRAALNYNGFVNWDVTKGTVDLIGNGSFDFYPGHGLYVDLDGTTSQSGTLSTKKTFAPGKYRLDFTLGGSQRGDTNVVDVSFGSSFNEAFTKKSQDHLIPILRTVTLSIPAKLSFHNRDGDNI